MYIAIRHTKTVETLEGFQALAEHVRGQKGRLQTRGRRVGFGLISGPTSITWLALTPITSEALRRGDAVRVTAKGRDVRVYGPDWQVLGSVNAAGRITLT